MSSKPALCGMHLTRIISKIFLLHQPITFWRMEPWFSWMHFPKPILHLHFIFSCNYRLYIHIANCQLAKPHSNMQREQSTHSLPALTIVSPLFQHVLHPFLFTSLLSIFIYKKPQQQQKNQDSFLSSWPKGACCFCQLGGHQNGSRNYHCFTTSVLSGCSPAGTETNPLDVPIKSFGLWSQGKKRSPNNVQKTNKECPADKQHGANGSDNHPADTPPLTWCVGVRSAGDGLRRVLFDPTVVREKVLRGAAHSVLNVAQRDCKIKKWLVKPHVC